MHLNPWHILVIAMAGWMNREQIAVIEYLKEENHVLRELRGAGFEPADRQVGTDMIVPRRYD